MKALVGSWDHRSYRLLAETTALRSRIAELEAEIAELRVENERLRAAVVEVDDVEVVLSGS